ncbi:MAG TPA: hypothetical protein V6C86_08585 [Oculatellaceae cyanobacterium]
MSDIPDKPKTVEIRRVDVNQSLPKDYNLIERETIEGLKKPKALSLKSGGLVAQFEVPPGWEKLRVLSRTFSKCRLENDGDVELQIGDIGLPVAPGDLSRMKKLFDSKNLTLSSSDVAFLQQAINYGSTMPIIVKSARVHDMSCSERVIDFVGRYNFRDGKNRSLRCFLVDVDGTTRFLEPITYLAPPNLFNKYMPQAEKIFNSIVTFSECPPFRNR